MKVGTPPRPKRPKSSAIIVGSTSATFSPPIALRKAGTRRATSAGVFTVGGTPPAVSTAGAGALWARARDEARRRMPSMSWSRTSSRKARRVSCRRTSSGMTLDLLPPWNEPTVTTAGSVGSTSRLTIVWRSSTRADASTIGSIVRSGIAPCPPLPRTTTSTVVEPAIAGPER